MRPYAQDYGHQRMDLMCCTTFVRSLLPADRRIIEAYRSRQPRHLWWRNILPDSDPDRGGIQCCKRDITFEGRSAILASQARSRQSRGDIRCSYDCQDRRLHSEPDLVCGIILLSVRFRSESGLRGMCDHRNVGFG